MGRIFQILTALFTYFCVATIVTQALGFGYLWSTDKLNKDKMFQMLAVLHDVNLQEMEGEKQRVGEGSFDPTQMSFDDVERLRGVKSRYLELKLQALDKGLEQVRFERNQLSIDKGRYVKLKTAFEKKIADLEKGNKAKGFADVRLIWENIKPKQAKEQIMKMVEQDEHEDIVVILADMPIGKRAKIVSTFTTEEEVKVLDTLMRMIRKGGAVDTLIDDARKEIQAVQPSLR